MTWLPWAALVVAGILEIGWAIGLKHTEGWTRLWPSVITIATMVASMYLLAYAVRTLPVGTAYAIWTGIGSVGVALLGIWFFGESAAIARLLCIALIVIGIVGLKVIT
jgi:quaternary ammonium compound-resistance protein SugE